MSTNADKPFEPFEPGEIVGFDGLDAEVIENYGDTGLVQVLTDCHENAEEDIEVWAWVMEGDNGEPINCERVATIEES